MGASAAAAATAVGHQVYLHHRRQGPMAEAVARGYGQLWQPASAEQPLPDLVVIGAPVAAVPSVVQELAPQTGEAILCDMGSTKFEVCHAVAQTGFGHRFVGAHPMCGSHHQGLAHADPTMFKNAACVY